MQLYKKRGFNKAPFSRIPVFDAELSIVYPIRVETELEFVYYINEIVLQPKRYPRGYNRQGWNRIPTNAYQEIDLEFSYLISTEAELEIVYDLEFAEAELVIQYEIASYYVDLAMLYKIQTEKELSIVYPISWAETDLSLLYRIKTEKELSIVYPISQAEIDLEIVYRIVTGEDLDIRYGGIILPGAKQDGYEDYAPTTSECLIHDGTIAINGSPELKYEVTFYCASDGVTEWEAIKDLIGTYNTLWVRGYRYKNCMITALKKRNLGRTNAVEFMITLKQDTSRERWI